MQLPPLLHRAVERILNGVARAELAEAAAALSQRYRDQQREGRVPIANRIFALAYVAARAPATYAATRASFAAVTVARPEFAPKTLLDIGAGPGTTLWAASDCWPCLAEALLVEANPTLQACGEELTAEAVLPDRRWRIADIAATAIEHTPHDLVIAAYVLNELDEEIRPDVLARMWRATADTLVIVEPGTPAGWRRLMAARRQLIEAGAHVIAPCPHAWVCPLAPPDWCHFAQRVARSRLHRLAKEAEVPWEDEKFSYLAVSRKPAQAPGSRVIATPRKSRGQVTLKLCHPDGFAGVQKFSRRDGAMFKSARRADWGDLL